MYPTDSDSHSAEGQHTTAIIANKLYAVTPQTRIERLATRPGSVTGLAFILAGAAIGLVWELIVSWHTIKTADVNDTSSEGQSSVLASALSQVSDTAYIPEKWVVISLAMAGLCLAGLYVLIPSMVLLVRKRRSLQAWRQSPVLLHDDTPGHPLPWHGIFTRKARVVGWGAFWVFVLLVASTTLWENSLLPVVAWSILASLSVIFLACTVFLVLISSPLLACAVLIYALAVLIRRRLNKKFPRSEHRKITMQGAYLALRKHDE